MGRQPLRPYRIVIHKLSGRWYWDCGLCKPPAGGCTSDWRTTVRHVARHCWRKSIHHKHVQEHKLWG